MFCSIFKLGSENDFRKIIAETNLFDDTNINILVLYSCLACLDTIGSLETYRDLRALLRQCLYNQPAADNQCDASSTRDNRRSARGTR